MGAFVCVVWHMKRHMAVSLERGLSERQVTEGKGGILKQTDHQRKEWVGFQLTLSILIFVLLIYSWGSSTCSVGRS